MPWNRKHTLFVHSFTVSPADLTGWNVQHCSSLKGTREGSFQAGVVAGNISHTWLLHLPFYRTFYWAFMLGHIGKTSCNFAYVERVFAVFKRAAPFTSLLICSPGPISLSVTAVSNTHPTPDEVPLAVHRILSHTQRCHKQNMDLCDGCYYLIPSCHPSISLNPSI